MKVTKVLSYLLISAFAVCLAFSCKEDDETTESKYMRGVFTFETPAFGKAYDTFTMKPEGEVKRAKDDDSDKTIGIYWAIPYFTSVLDTVRKEGEVGPDGSMTVTLPSDTLATLSFTCGFFASGYNTNSVTRYTTIVDPDPEGESLKGIVRVHGYPSFTDTRDGKYYHTIPGGTNTLWMQRNLGWSGGGQAYHGCSVVDELFGRMYTWEEAQTACPEGWRLPSEADWVALAESVSNEKFEPFVPFKGIAGKFMGSVTFNGERMWPYSPYVDSQGNKPFFALPMGYASILNKDGYTYHDYCVRAVFWTSEEYKGYGVYRSFYMNSPNIEVDYANKKEMAASVRCVRDYKAE